MLRFVELHFLSLCPLASFDAQAHGHVPTWRRRS